MNAAAACLVAILVCFVGASAQNGVGNPVAFVKCTEAAQGGNLAVSYLSAGGRVMASDAGGVLRAMDDVRFETIWKAELGGEIASNVAIQGDLAYVVNNSQTASDDTVGASVLRSVNVNTGLTLRSVPLPYSVRFTLYATADGVVALGLSGTATMYDVGLGRMVWESRSSVGLAPVSDSSNGLIVTAKDGGVMFLDSRTGATVVEIKADAAITATTLAGADTAFIGDERGNVSKINLPSGQTAWSFKTGGGVNFLRVVDGSLFVASNDNFFYRISADSGRVIWRKRMPGRIIIPPLILADHVFLPVVGENSVIVAEIDKGKSVGRMMLGNERFPSSAIFATSNGRLAVPAGSGLSVFSNGDCAASVEPQ